MTTTTATTTEPASGFHDRCPDWCRNSEHRLRTDISGTYRVGDDEPRDPHWRPVGRLPLESGVTVGLVRENIHGQPYSLELLDRRDRPEVQVSVERRYIVEASDAYEPAFNLTPATARSLARILTAAADLAEGVAS